MENAAQAFRIAGWVLIFVVALSICINAFSRAKEAMDTILEYSDRTNMTEYLPDDKKTERIVNYESIVPTIYRAYKENFTIVFKFSNSDDDKLYDYVADDGTTLVSINYIDLETASVSDIPIANLSGVVDKETLRDYFIRRILFGVDGIYKDTEDVPVYSVGGTTLNKNAWCERQLSRFRFRSDGLYQRLDHKNFKETIGVYYQEEKASSDGSGKTEVPEANRTEKRIITYTQVP